MKKVFSTNASIIHTLLLFLQRQIFIQYGKEPFKQVRLAGFDFRQEILSQGCDIEVLEPKWFRDEMAEIAKNMWNKNR